MHIYLSSHSIKILSSIFIKQCGSSQQFTGIVLEDFLPHFKLYIITKKYLSIHRVAVYSPANNISNSDLSCLTHINKSLRILYIV